MGNASCLFSKRVIPGFLFSKLFDDPMQHFKTDPTWVDPYTDEEIENILVVMIKELGNTDYITKTLSARKLQMSLRYMLIGFSLFGLFSHLFAAAPTGYGYNKYKQLILLRARTPQRHMRRHKAWNGAQHHAKCNSKLLFVSKPTLLISQTNVKN